MNRKKIYKKSILFSKFIPKSRDFNEYSFRIIWKLSADSKLEIQSQLDIDGCAAVIDEVSLIEHEYQFLIGSNNPFLRDDLPEILNYIKLKRLKPVIYMKSGVLSESNLLLLKKNGIDEIIVVCDDDNQKLHYSLFLLSHNRLKFHVVYKLNENNITKIGLAFKRAVEFKALSFMLRFPANKDEYKVISASDLEDIFNFLYTSMVGNTIYIDSDNAPQYRRYIVERYMEERHGKRRRLLDEIAIPGVHLELEKASFIFKSPEFMIRDSNLKNHGLNSGDGIMFINYDGKIFPSQELPIECLNITENNLLEVYRNSTVFKELRDRKKITGKCGECPYVTICGGSRERAFSYTRNYLSAEPLCNFYFGAKLVR